MGGVYVGSQDFVDLNAPLAALAQDLALPTYICQRTLRNDKWRFVSNFYR